METLEIVVFSSIDKRIKIKKSDEDDSYPIAWIDNDDTTEGPKYAVLFESAPEMQIALERLINSSSITKTMDIKFAKKVLRKSKRKIKVSKGY